MWLKLCLGKLIPLLEFYVQHKGKSTVPLLSSVYKSLDYILSAKYLKRHFLVNVAVHVGVGAKVLKLSDWNMASELDLEPTVSETFHANKLQVLGSYCTVLNLSDT